MYHNVLAPAFTEVECLVMKNSYKLSSKVNRTDFSYDIQCDYGEYRLGTKCFSCEKLFGAQAAHCEATKICRSPYIGQARCYCSKGFSGDTCSEVRYPILVHLPRIKMINESTVSVELFDIAYDGPYPPTEFLIQIKESAGNGGFKNASALFKWSKNVGKEKHFISGLKPRTQYQLRLLLLANNTVVYNENSAPWASFQTYCSRLLAEDFSVLVNGTVVTLVKNKVVSIPSQTHVFIWVIVFIRIQSFFLKRFFGFNKRCFLVQPRQMFFLVLCN